MVWGLNSNNSHHTHTKSQSTSIHGHKTLPRGTPLPQVNPIPFPHNQDSTIQGLRGQGGVEFSRLECRALSSKGEVPSRADPDHFEDQQRFRNDTRNDKGGFYEVVRRDSPIQLYPPSVGLLSSEVNSRKAGLGIDLYRDAQESNTVLRSASVDGKAVYHIQTYDEYRRQSGIPTPPNTDPSQWSPLFHPTLTTASVQCAKPQSSRLVKSPRLQPTPLGLPSLSIHKAKGQTLPSVAPGHWPAAGPAGVSDRNPWAPDTGMTNDHDFNFEGQNNLTQSFFQLCSVRGEPIPPSLDSPDLRQDFAQRQPRSVPLVRLIQRRLSSVVEEGADMGKGTRAQPGETVLARLNQVLDHSGSGLNMAAREGTRHRVLNLGSTVPGSSLGLSTGNSKQMHEPFSHPSRHHEEGLENARSNIRKAVNTINSEEHNETLKANIKRRKTYRKKKYTS